MKRIFALIFVLALILVLASCGKEKESEVSRYSEADAKHDREALEEYLAGPDGQKMIDNYISGFPLEQFTTDCYADDCVLVFVHKSKTQLNNDDYQIIKPSIEDYLNNFSEDHIIDQLKNDASIIGPRIKLLFQNANGSTLGLLQVYYVDGYQKQTQLVSAI